jgi:hypothetical protein
LGGSRASVGGANPLPAGLLLRLHDFFPLKEHWFVGVVGSKPADGGEGVGIQPVDRRLGFAVGDLCGLILSGGEVF